ncbi:protein ALTERED SEED GERMINATION 2-like isoform X1 [Rosa rugosa]|uniref:protein ALTERED SEED GERMINATION 2-like isoform X1 n=1 Tax=Rosa rugosa TaxID=74645 RepID=UPI002B4054DE|nr:protein ALTERED SEED GERMINATION 2-like isoform X1 [Rosa rugosa]
MNVNHAGGSDVQYTSGDASKIMSFIAILNGLELQQPASSVFRSRLPKKRKATAMLLQHEKCSKLTQIAEKSLEEGNFYHGIEACNEVLDGYGRDIGPILRHDCLCTRAAFVLKVLLISSKVTWLDYGTLI